MLPLTDSTLVNRLNVLNVSELQISAEFPVLQARESPTVAIITSLFCEKIAVDLMLEGRKTYIRHNPDLPINGNEHKYFLQLKKTFCCAKCCSSRVVA